MFGRRWLVGGGALLVACVALYILLRVGGPSNNTSDRTSAKPSAIESSRERADHRAAQKRELRDPALDEIDAKSRKAMRELLRQADRDE